jgi:hypothetical protein
MKIHLLLALRHHEPYAAEWKRLIALDLTPEIEEGIGKT